jgi:hypothetical protein
MVALAGGGLVGAPPPALETFILSMASLVGGGLLHLQATTCISWVAGGGGK